MDFQLPGECRRRAFEFLLRCNLLNYRDSFCFHASCLPVYQEEVHQSEIIDLRCNTKMHLAFRMHFSSYFYWPSFDRPSSSAPTLLIQILLTLWWCTLQVASLRWCMRTGNICCSRNIPLGTRFSREFPAFDRFSFALDIRHLRCSCRAEEDEVVQQNSE